MTGGGAARDDAAADGERPLLVALDPARGEPLRRQLAGELREAIRAGRLRTGVRLPASRALAAQLGVSRGVVTDAYEQLDRRGLARRPPRRRDGRRRRPGGRARAPGAAAPRRRALRLHGDHARRVAVPAPRRGRGPSRAPPRRRPTPSSTTAAASAAWRCARRSPATSAACAAPPPGRPGSSSARATPRPTRLLFGVLAERGMRRVAFEDPSLARPLGRGGPRRAGDRPDPARRRGPARRRARARATPTSWSSRPSHQFPTGAVMGPERRHALLRWARAGDRLVIEDDYDAEFRYDRRPLGGAAGARPRARRLRRDRVQDARAGAAAGLDPRARRARPRPRGARSSPPTPAPRRSTSSRSRT